MNEKERLQKSLENESRIIQRQKILKRLWRIDQEEQNESGESNIQNTA